MGRKKLITTDYVKKMMADRYGDEYTVLGEYTNRGTKIKLRHNKCGHEFEKLVDNLLYNDQTCVKCGWDKMSNSRKKHGQEGLNRILGNEFKLVSKYDGENNTIMLEGVKCGHKFTTTYSLFKKRPYCRVCRKIQKTTIQSPMDFFELVKQKYGDKFIQLGVYSAMRTPVEFIDRASQEHFVATPYMMLNTDFVYKPKGVINDGQQ